MKSSLIVGIPKEIKPLEKRVGLIPSAVRKLTERGIRVLIEQKAGVLSGFDDSEYREAGAEIVPDARSVYQQAGLIQKVKEPQPREFELIKDQILFCFLHLASPENSKLREVLLQSRCTAIGFESVEKEGRLPVLMPMSRIAGALAAAYAAYFQKFLFTGKIVYPEKFLENLERIAGLYPEFQGQSMAGKAVIFGGGIAGTSALSAVLQLKGEAAIVEVNEERRKELKKMISLVFSPQQVPDELLQNSDVWIGCVHSRGQQAVQVLDPLRFSAITRFKKKIIMDVAIDQGGNFPEAHSTSYAEPLYLDSCGNFRFAVPNIPSFCGRAASQALSEATQPYTQSLALEGAGAFSRFPELAKAVAE